MTRVELAKLVAEYPKLRLQERAGPSSMIIRTPPHWSARDWVALVEFKADGTILRVGYGTTDYAPVRPRYAEDAPPLMPHNQCFGTAAECEQPW